MNWRATTLLCGVITQLLLDSCCAFGLPFNSKIAYSFSKVEFLAENPTILNLNLSFKQKSVELHDVSCDVFLSSYADADLKIDFNIVKSKTSDRLKDMRPSLIKLPSTDSYAFMDSIYKPHLMEYFKDCADLPQFSGRWGKRSLAGNYTMNNCPLDSTKTSSIFTEGYYCLMAHFTRKIAPTLNGVLRIFMQVKNI